MKPAEPMLNAVRGNERLRAELLAALSEDRLPHSLLLAVLRKGGQQFSPQALVAAHSVQHGLCGLHSFSIRSTLVTKMVAPPTVTSMGMAMLPSP